VAVESGVGDAEAPLDGGDGRAVSSRGCLFEDGVDGGLDGVGVGRARFTRRAPGRGERGTWPFPGAVPPSGLPPTQAFLREYVDAVFLPVLVAA